MTVQVSSFQPPGTWNDRRNIYGEGRESDHVGQREGDESKDSEDTETESVKQG